MNKRTRASGAETQDLSPYQLLPDDIFNYIGGLCTPRFAFILVSKDIFARSRCDIKNGFLFDKVNLINAGFSFTENTTIYAQERRAVISLLSSFNRDSDEIFYHLYQTLKWCCQNTRSREYWNTVFRSRYLHRLLKNPSFDVKDYIHPTEYDIKIVGRKDADLLRDLFIDIISSTKLTSGACAERISPFYRRFEFIDDHHHIYENGHNISNMIIFGDALLKAYLRMPRIEETDARFRAVLYRIFYPHRIDRFVRMVPLYTISSIALLAVYLFGDYAWNQMFQLGNLPLDFVFWPDLLAKDFSEDIIPDKYSREKCTEDRLLAHELFGTDLPRILEQWIQRAFIIVTTCEDPNLHLSYKSTAELGDGEYNNIVQVLHLATNLFITCRNYRINLPWIKLFHWMRRHWNAIWGFFHPLHRLDFLKIASENHFLSGLLKLDMMGTNDFDKEYVIEWLTNFVTEEDLDKANFSTMLWFLLAKCPRAWKSAMECETACSDNKKKLLSYWLDKRIKISPMIRFYDKIREAEKDYAHLLVE